MGSRIRNDPSCTAAQGEVPSGEWGAPGESPALGVTPPSSGTMLRSLLSPEPRWEAGPEPAPSFAEGAREKQSWEKVREQPYSPRPWAPRPDCLVPGCDGSLGHLSSCLRPAALHTVGTPRRRTAGGLAGTGVDWPKLTLNSLLPAGRALPLRGQWQLDPPHLPFLFRFTLPAVSEPATWQGCDSPTRYGCTVEQ